MFCATAASIISGAVAERLKFNSYLIITAFVGTLLYPVVGHWAWANSDDNFGGDGTSCETFYLDISYSSDQDIAGFQFDVDGATIVSAGVVMLLLQASQYLMVQIQFWVFH